MSEILERAKQLLSQGEQKPPAGDPLVDRARRILAENYVRENIGGEPVGSSRTIQRVKDPGVIGSFGAGVKKGVKESFSFGRAHDEPNPMINSAPEKVAEFLGYMGGLGIGFVPYSVGTGMVLKGLGFAAPLVSEPLYGFVKNTIAGAAQAGAMSEDRSQIPGNIALGAVAGGVVEGFFLSRAMRARAGVLPTQAGNQLAKELAVAPAEGSSPAVVESVIEAIKPDNFNFDQVLADMAQTHETTMRIPFVSNTEELLTYAKSRLPSTAQVLQSGDRVLIHNPIDPADALSPGQVSQWVADDSFDGMEVIYNGKTYAATGVPVGPDRIQLRGIGSKRGLVFAPKRSAVTLPINPKIFTQSAIENAAKRERLNTIAQKAKEQMGFVVQTSAATVERGMVDVTKYAEAPSFGDFARQHQPIMKQMSGLVGDTPEDIVYDYARKRGIPGLLVRDSSGTVTEVRIFDPTSVTYTGQSLPMVGIAVDKVAVGTTQREIRGFIPSWKNAIAPALQLAGVPEKEIRNYLDLYAQQLGKRNRELLGEEFTNRLEAAEKLYFEGCR